MIAMPSAGMRKSGVSSRAIIAATMAALSEPDECSAADQDDDADKVGRGHRV
jgi:hypothetical protein